MSHNSLIESAIEVAARAHSGQTRKGSDIPYIAHPYAVGMMLQQAGYPPEVVAAGILHDTVEDTTVTLDDLRRDFGEKIALIVEGCSEPDKSASWEERKRHTLAHLVVAPDYVRAVSCADKLHNVSAMLADYQRLGDRLWARFNRGKREQEWYYRGLVSALCQDRPDEAEIPFCAPLRIAVDQLFGSDPGA